ncbi:MAG: hypothetical protein Q9160_001544 [Pyrenula sp. 1 TL-2023]
MHEKYGPIVRITPHEIHIDDPHFYESIYTSSAKRVDKYDWWVKLGGAPGSAWATVDHNLHRIRRGALNPFFSKRSVLQLEHIIQEKIDKFVGLLEVASGHNTVVRLDTLFIAVTVDIITQYAFSTSYNHLDRSEPGLEWKEMMDGGFEAGNTLRHFPWMLQVQKSFPNLLAAFSPSVATIVRWQRSLHQQVSSILAEGRLKHESGKSSSYSGDNEDTEGLGPTIFHTLRDSELPSKERSLDRLCDEAEIITGAGSETTAKTLYTTVFYITNNRAISQRLRQELFTLPADARLVQIEQLPYLTSVIKEGLRLSYGASVRLPRIFYEPLQYGDWVIPAGTPVSETIPFVSMSRAIFPVPEEYRPERWIEAKKEGKRLDRYLVSFCKGSRACIGINLAWGELYLILFHLFRKFELELYETTIEDVGFKHDFFVPMPKLNTKGVRVQVRKVEKA